MTKITKAEAKQIAEHVDAYSRDRYTDAAWLRIAARLAEFGFTAREITWTLTSKHMRWAADCANRNHSATAADFLAYVEHSMSGLHGLAGLQAAARKETATGADLAGACEGEEIADLITLAQMAAKGTLGIQARAREILARIQARANVA